MFKSLLQATIGAMLISVAQHASATSFYFGAHADDVELFMARNAGYDVASGAKVVFVTTTTGSFVRDGKGVVRVRGAGVYSDIGSSTPYYLTREAGQAAALATWYKLQNKPYRADNVTDVVIAGKTVKRTEIGGMGSNVIMYNLRLVDGDVPDQSGLTWFRNQSLTDPYARIHAVDNSASYTWNELKTFVNALIAREQNSEDTWVNIQEYWEDGVPEVNYTHDDHKTTARLVSHALSDYARNSPTRCIRTIQWIDYASQDKPVNYTANEQSLQNLVRNNATQAMLSAQGPDLRGDIDHDRWLHRIYASANGINGITRFGPCPRKRN